MHKPLLSILIVWLSAISPAFSQDSTVQSHPVPVERIRYRGKQNWHGGFGISGGSINFNRNGFGDFLFPLRYDFLHVGRSTFSLGTRFSFGSEDENGISFPVLVAFLLIFKSAGVGDDWSNFTNGSGGKEGLAIRFFTDEPILLHYNWGYGTANGSDAPIGFFLGAGPAITITGYSYEHNQQRTATFWGLQADGGLRFPLNTELGFSVTHPLDGPVGPIQNPLMYQIRLCVMF